MKICPPFKTAVRGVQILVFFTEGSMFKHAIMPDTPSSYLMFLTFLAYVKNLSHVYNILSMFLSMYKPVCDTRCKETLDTHGMTVCLI